MKEIVSTLIRNILKACGPLLAAKGVMDEQSAEVLGGAIATIIGIAWGLFDAQKAREAKEEVKKFKAGQPGKFTKASQTNQ